MKKTTKCGMCKSNFRQRTNLPVLLVSCKHCGTQFCMKTGCGEISNNGPECGTCSLQRISTCTNISKKVASEIDHLLRHRSPLLKPKRKSFSLKSQAVRALGFSKTVLKQLQEVTNQNVSLVILKEGKVLAADRKSEIEFDHKNSSTTIQGLSLVFSSLDELVSLRQQLSDDYSAYRFATSRVENKYYDYVIVLKSVNAEDFLKVRNTLSSSNRVIRSKVRNWHRHYGAHLLGAADDNCTLLFPSIDSTRRRSRICKQISEVCPQITNFYTEEQLDKSLLREEYINLIWSINR